MRIEDENPKEGETFEDLGITPGSMLFLEVDEQGQPILYVPHPDDPPGDENGWVRVSRVGPGFLELDKA